MTRYPAWKKRQIQRSWKSLISVFICVTLFFAIFNGLAKGFSLGGKLADPDWDGRSAFTVVVDSQDPALFVYQKEPRKLAIFTLDGQTSYDTGKVGTPLEKIADNSTSGEDLTLNMSKTLGVKIENFLELKDKIQIGAKEGEETFKDFASFTTPFALLTTGYKNNITDTNITRLDALRLWWQIKGLGIHDVVFRDLSNIREEILVSEGNRVLGADTGGLNKEVSTYLENFNIVEEGYAVTIRNQSGNVNALRLANFFAGSVGAKVVSVEDSSVISDNTVVLTTSSSSYTAKHLAKIFNCDINDAPKSGEDKKIEIVLGQDFANYYFE